MSYFKDNWDAELQNEVLESVEVIVCFFGSVPSHYLVTSICLVQGTIL